MGVCESSKEKKQRKQQNKRTQPQSQSQPQSSKQTQKNTNPYLKDDENDYVQKNNQNRQKQNTQRFNTEQNPYLNDDDENDYVHPNPKKNNQPKVTKNVYLEDNEDDYISPKQKKKEVKESTSNSETTGGSFEKECLEIHNQFRKIHHAPPLKLNNELNKIAMSWAQHLAETNNFAHSGNSWKGESLGENIFCCMGQKMTGKSMTQSWYNEIKDYNYNGENKKMVGHFTQVVWKESELLGVGYAQAKNGYYYGVCNYYPPGNYQGEYESNVLRP